MSYFIHRIYKSTPNELTVKNTKGGKSVIIKKNNFPDAGKELKLTFENQDGVCIDIVVIIS